MVWARGVERLGVRAFSVGASAYFSYQLAKPHLERGDYGGAAVRATPFVVTLGTNAAFFYRDARKYGSMWGVIGNTAERGSKIGDVFVGTGSAARTSAELGGKLRVAGKALGYVGFVMDLSQTQSDAPRPGCIGCPR